jgi:SAM-dependent methyltransferase
MGIAPYIAEALIREHKHRPITGDVLLLGRQSFLFSLEHARDMLRAEGIEPVSSVAGEHTIDQTTRAGQGQRYVKDAVFFELLGVRSTTAIDHSPYEGAEIIHDLNTPVPSNLENIADFILDGSTLDNLFNPATALQSMARMLRPDGRFVSVNMASPHLNPYTLLTPFWFADYLALNKFDDYRIYVTLHGRRGELNVFTLNPADENSPVFPVTGLTGIVVFAEKGADTTWHKIPSQRIYADQDTLREYGSAANLISQNDRPELLWSKRPMSLGFSPTRHLLEHYLMVAFISRHFLQIDDSGKKEQAKVPATLAFAKWLRRRIGPNLLP